VVGLGALNIDHLYRVRQILADGETVTEQSKSSPGGSAANTIYGLAKLGVKAGFIGAIGSDAEGKIMLRSFQKVGVDTSQINIKQGASTGSVFCLIDKQGRRSLYVSPGANNLLDIDDVDLDYIKQSKLLHISSFVDDRQFKLNLQLIEKLLGNQPSSHLKGVKLSFSPGALYVAKGFNTLAPILAHTHTLFLNRDEIKQLTGKEFPTGAKTCLEAGCQIVAVTLGKGIKCKNKIATSYIRDKEGEYLIEQSSPVTVRDTTGAGDAFATGFLYGLLNSKGLDECGRLGDIVARFVISKMGAREGLPTLAQLAKRYQELYPD